ncbi:MAG: prepilin-type N-terminal cleavage/methylation domain-containing protein [Desulfobacteraceae bacterium]|nr:prepilin-type N-terminal cleavage/methylation domain-containing protein [Desulfobacteraceae bacterium]MBC2756906.1 prepilin-type N-terminal cleavage/methylation domain-containing protein [Desulfobacteraceae bacterium]
MNQHLNKKTDGSTLVEVMVVIAIIAILAAIAIPNYMQMRNKGYCSEAETDADHIAAAIADYFGTPGRTEVPTMADLKITLLNHADILGTDPNVSMTIQVTDRMSRCPVNYQNAHSGWDSNFVYSRTID